jgi:hypothetical protein
MDASFQRPVRLLAFLSFLAAGLALPQAAVAQVEPARSLAIQAFQDSADVTEAIAKIKARRVFSGVSEDGDPAAVQLSESCGAAGCYYSFLVTQLLSPRPTVNPQATSVSAVVRVSPRGGAGVTLMNLTGTRQGMP